MPKKTAQLRIFIPKTLECTALEQIRNVCDEAGVKWETCYKPCNLEDVNAATFSFEGTKLWLRAPFVHPFCRGRLRNEYPQDNLDTLDVDWIWLGTDTIELGQSLSQYMRSAAVPSIDVIVFDAFEGQLRQTIDRKEPHKQLSRKARNYNLVQWDNACAQMLGAVEEDWPKFSSNTSDRLPMLLPYLDALVGSEPKHILDWGCGVGQTTRSLALRYPEAQVLGIDSSRAAIHVANSHFRSDNLHFMVGNIGDRLPFPDKTLDIIVSINALMYGANQVATAKEVFRTLSDNGAFIQFSRMLDSHMYWDFPRSLGGPTVFQINVADWSEEGKRQGFNTMVLPPPNMSDVEPGYFYPRVSNVFSVPFKDGVQLEKEQEEPDFSTWMTHALILHSRAVQNNQAELGEKNWLARLDKTLSQEGQYNAKLREATIASWNLNAASLHLCAEAKDFLLRILPESNATLDRILLRMKP